MELFYNPERMTEREIKETFVAHQWLVDEIISILKRQPDGPGVQHVVIVAPRGMGKTTMLLMLRFTVLGTNLGGHWLPVLFPEESYDVYELADLWLAVLNQIAATTRDIGLEDEISRITPDSSHLEEKALARVKNWRTQNGKRLMLLIDNFDMILEQIGDERDNARLRDVLINDGTLMLVGGATTFFKEARAYDQPLYNLFKIYNLNTLDSNQIRDLLRRRAELDNLEDFDETLRANESRIRVLEYFTGGNPRLVLMLYRIITHSEISEVRQGLEKLLDEVTPYYKAKVETLPPQQRKILDQIARSTSRTREGMTPTEIATGTRLPVNQVSSQLKRLSEAGYVHTANIRGRSSYYTLSEPLYAIWHQMRFGRDARKRMNWLVAFLKNWYDAKELGTECERLQQIFHSYLIAGRQHEARGALEHRRYLMEAIEDSDTRASTFESVVLDYLELSDIDTLKSDVLIDVDINDLSQETQRLLVNAGLVIDERVKLRLGSQLTDQRLQAEAAANLELAIIALNSGLPEEATARLQNILNLDPYDFEANLYLAIIEAFIGKSDESSARFAELEKNLTPDSPNSLMLRSAKAYIDNRADDTIQHLDEMLRRGASKRAWHMKALLLKRAHRPEEAIQAIRNIAEEERDFDSWYTLAELLEDLDRNEAAVETLDQAIKHSPQSVDALRMKSRILFKLGRYDEALVFTDRVLSIKSDSAVDWFSRGAILINNESLEEAVKSLERGIELSPKFTPGLLLNAVILRRLGRTDQSHLYLNKVLELDPECVDAHLLRATLSASTNLEESMASVRQAFAIKDRSRSYLSDLPVTMAFRAILSALGNDVKGFKSAWNDLLQSSDRHSNRTEWLSGAANALRGLAVAGQWSLARELITSSQLDEELFPLARALDYLQTNEEALIEKLSPEVRQIVIEIVTTLTLETSRVREKQRKKRSKKSGIKKQIKN